MILNQQHFIMQSEIENLMNKTVKMCSSLQKFFVTTILEKGKKSTILKIFYNEILNLKIDCWRTEVTGKKYVNLIYNNY